MINKNALIEQSFHHISAIEQTLKNDKLYSLFSSEKRLNKTLEKLNEQINLLKTCFQKLDTLIQKEDVEQLNETSKELDIIFDQIENLSFSGKSIAFQHEDENIRNSPLFMEITKLLVSLEPIVFDIFSLFEINRKRRNHPLLSQMGTISSQFSLLLLNSSIEAARLGEKGRGFAVVNEELRRLSVVLQQTTNELKDALKNQK